MDAVIQFHKLKQEYEAAQRKAATAGASEDDIQAATECCRRFKLRCKHDINEIPQALGSPDRSVAEKAGLEAVYKAASEYLPELEKHCPGDGGEPLPGPPARRGMSFPPRRQ